MDEGWLTIVGFVGIVAAAIALVWLWEHHYYFPFFILLAVSIAFVVATGEHPDYPIDVRH